MSIRGNTRFTFYACYLGYVSQAIVNNFVPLLFLTFQDTFSLSLSQITLLTTVNFWDSAAGRLAFSRDL